MEKIKNFRDRRGHALNMRFLCPSERIYREEEIILIKD